MLHITGFDMKIKAFFQSIITFGILKLSAVNVIQYTLLFVLICCQLVSGAWLLILYYLVTFDYTYIGLLEPIYRFLIKE